MMGLLSDKSTRHYILYTCFNQKRNCMCPVYTIYGRTWGGGAELLLKYKGRVYPKLWSRHPLDHLPIHYALCPIGPTSSESMATICPSFSQHLGPQFMADSSIMTRPSLPSQCDIILGNCNDVALPIHARRWASNTFQMYIHKNPFLLHVMLQPLWGQCVQPTDT
jgi:hypothetical protein